MAELPKKRIVARLLFVAFSFSLSPHHLYLRSTTPPCGGIGGKCRRHQRHKSNENCGAPGVRAQVGRLRVSPATRTQAQIIMCLW